MKTQRLSLKNIFLNGSLDIGIGNECLILDVLEDGMVNDWDILVLAEMIMNGGN